MVSHVICAESKKRGNPIGGTLQASTAHRRFVMRSRAAIARLRPGLAAGGGAAGHASRRPRDSRATTTDRSVRLSSVCHAASVTSQHYESASKIYLKNSFTFQSNLISIFFRFKFVNNFNIKIYIKKDFLDSE